jgi:hypothetical protein
MLRGHRMEIIETNNNLFDTIHYLVLQEQQDNDTDWNLWLYTYFQTYPLRIYETGIKDDINQKLLLIDLLKQKSLWEIISTVQEIYHALLTIPKGPYGAYQILICYVTKLLEQLHQFVIYNGYLQINKAISTNFLGDDILLHQFFLSTNHLPVESLSGYYSFLNPIYKEIISTLPDDANFLLNDYMMKEIYETKEEIKKDCYFICIKQKEALLKLFQSLKALTPKEYYFSNLYYEDYYSICRMLLKRIQQREIQEQKRTR